MLCWSFTKEAIPTNDWISRRGLIACPRGCSKMKDNSCCDSLLKFTTNFSTLVAWGINIPSFNELQNYSMPSTKLQASTSYGRISIAMLSIKIWEVAMQKNKVDRMVPPLLWRQPYSRLSTIPKHIHFLCTRILLNLMDCIARPHNLLPRWINANVMELSYSLIVLT